MGHVRARAMCNCRQRFHERKSVRLPQIGLGHWWYSNTGLPLGPCKDIIKGYLWRGWSQCRQFSINLVTHPVMLHTQDCVHTERKLGNHYAIIGAVPIVSWWGATKAAFSVGSVIQKIAPFFMSPWAWEPSFAFGITSRKSWYRSMLHTPILLMSAPNIFHGWNGNTQLSRTRKIDDAMRLFQIIDLVMFGLLVRHISDPDYKPWYALLMLPATHLKLDFQIHNVCHCFVSLDQSEAWQVINFSIYWKRSILSPVLPKIKYFPKNKSHGKTKLKKGRLVLINSVP